MVKLRHYRNVVPPGAVAFVTTTCLDFTPYFGSHERRDRMVRQLFDDSELYGATLHAYVVMPEHIHFVCLLPPSHDAVWFVNRIKSSATVWLRQCLTDAERDRIRSGGFRTFWQRSFRSVEVSGAAIAVKAEYVNANPVRRGLVAEPSAYRWSSAAEFESGVWRDDFAVPRPTWLR